MRTNTNAMKNLLLLMAVAFGISSTSMVIAQQKKSYVPVQLQKISLSEGNWSGSAKLQMADSTYEFPYSISFSSANEGRTYYAEEKYEVGPIGAISGVSLIAFNKNDKKVHWFRTDNQGNCRDQEGTWVNGTNFVMNASETIDGKSFEESTKLTFWGKNTIDIHIERKVGGEVTEQITATLNRSM